MIVEGFHVPWQQTMFRTDVHYTIDRDELDRLFSQQQTSHAAPPHNWAEVGGRQKSEEPMATDQEVIDAVRYRFAAEPCPEDFTDHRHCCECAEHDALLATRDVGSLRLEDVNNADRGPICFVTAEGSRYYLPALVRLALKSAMSENWYLPRLLFHLAYEGPQNRRVLCCSAAQQRAIGAVLWHVVQTRPALVVRHGIEDDLQRPLEIWSAPAS
jgi:hypothetical protein